MDLKHVSIGSAIALVTGCATLAGPPGDEITKAVDTWIGQPIERAVLQWGPPSRQTTVGSKQLYVWRDDSEVPIYSSGITTTYGNIGGMPASATTYGPGSVHTVSVFCEWTLYIDATGVVTDTYWKGRGDACDKLVKMGLK